MRFQRRETPSLDVLSSNTAAIRLHRTGMPADDGQAQSSCPAGSIVQYIFFGGIDRFISLRKRATAAAFFRLRFAVGVS
jgi:hypothetical protein